MEEMAKVLVLGVFAALAIAFIKYGPAGPRMWWEAKYFGKAAS